MRKLFLLTTFQCFLLTGTVALCQSTNHIARHNQKFFSSYSQYKFEQIIAKLRDVKYVTSRQVGWGRAPGEFHKLSKEAMTFGTAIDFASLLEDGNPVIRVMGLVGLAQTKLGNYTNLLKSRLGDEAEVNVMLGCGGHKATVGEIAKWLDW